MKIIQLSLRSLLRFKLYTSINIIGLALSLACSMAISRYIYREMTVDHFVENLDLVCQPSVHYSNEIQPRFCYSFENSPTPKNGILINHPSIQKIAPYATFDQDIISIDKKDFNVRTIVTDSTFLRILTYPIIDGNKYTPLNHPQSAVITQELAQKLFGSQNPIGKTFRHSTGNELTVTAVIGNPDSKSSLSFDLLIPLNLKNEWGRMFYAFVLLAPNTDINALNEELSHKSINDKYNIAYKLLPFSKAYFDHTTNTFDKIHIRGNYANILVLFIVGFLILLVGIFNFVNLYTVIMMKRAREFGMKKVFGAKTSQIITQLLGENMVMIGISLFIAWAFIETTKSLIESQLSIPQISNLKFDLSLSAVILFVLPIITSAYPFIKYNYFSPISSLRSVNAGGYSIRSRSIFLSMQYIITFTLIVVSIFFMKQLDFMLHADLGYRTKDIIKVQFLKNQDALYNMSNEDRQEYFTKTYEFISAIKQEMDASPLFQLWTYGESPNQYDEYPVRVKTQEGDFKEVFCFYMSPQAMKLFNLKAIEGRLWDEAQDESLDYKLIINECAKKTFNIKDIHKTILQSESRLFFKTSQDFNTNPPFQIVGVVNDFRNAHLSKAIMPLIIVCNSESSSEKLMAAITPGKTQEAIQFLKKLKEEIVGGEFSYSFVEDEVKNMYSEDKKTAMIYSVFAIMAILISSLGLFGLSLFDVQQRYREIAIRKINGAQVSKIILLLLRKYYILLLVSFIIAIPLSYFAIRQYLENFAYKAPISWWIFVFAAVITSAISLSTLLYQVRKAANSNPANVLKSE